MSSPATLSHTACYEIFGEQIRVFASDEAVTGFADDALQAFSTRALNDPIADFHIRGHDGDGRIRQGKRMHSGGLMVIADRHKLITASLATFPWQIHIDAFGRDAGYVFYYLFEPLLHMVLKRRGLVQWHGAAVQRDGRDVLVVGASGSGKSTTALCLLMNGYDYLADDELFLDSRHGLPRIRSVERAIHYTAGTAELLPSLRARSQSPLVRRGQGVKYRLDASSLPTAATAGEIRCVLFPRVHPDGPTRCEPISKAETLRRLLTHPPKEYPALIADSPSVQSHFDTCAALANSAAAYEIVLGRDLHHLPHLVGEALR